jgi:hypothetical protein
LFAASLPEPKPGQSLCGHYRIPLKHIQNLKNGKYIKGEISAN